jgi:uncharacterized protein with GYD domain
MGTSPVRDTYFSLWTLTEEGIGDAAALEATIKTASAMIRDVGATCKLYVTVGSPYDLIGVAQGANLDDTKIVAIQQAIRVFGTLRTEFIKAREFSLEDYAEYLAEVKRLRGLKSPDTAS